MKRTKKRRLKKWVPVTVIALLVIGIFAGGFLISYAKIKPAKDRICDGVFVGEISLGQMTKEEASDTIAKYVKELSRKELILTVQGNAVQTSLETLGFTCDENEFVKEALAFGKSGNLIKRYKEIKDLEKKNKVFELSFSVNKKKTNSFVKKECAPYIIEAKDATMTRVNGAFRIIKETTGQKIDVDATVEVVANAVKEQLGSDKIQAEAVVIVDEPKYCADDLKKVKDKLGTFTTSFTQGAINRTKNIRNAVSFIDGNVVYPGQALSARDEMSPLTADNGYEEAPSYLNGNVVDSIGGGICQVSTTLYNAVLLSELQVVERNQHSMAVSYVKPAMDAAISETGKDFKFKNNLEYPVYVEGYVNGGTVTFSIYGCEMRNLSTRKVVYESEVTETNVPKREIEKVDKTKPKSYRAVTQQAHIGYKANLWKVVYENGEEVSREKVNYSSYASAPAYVTVGGMKEEKKDNDKDKDKDKDKKPAASSEPTTETGTETTQPTTDTPTASSEPAVPSTEPNQPAEAGTETTDGETAGTEQVQ